MAIYLGQPNGNYITPTGTFVADEYGLIKNVNDVSSEASLESFGCVKLAPVPTNLLGFKLQADFNSTLDQIIPLNTLLITKYRPTRITVLNASISLSTAEGGFYTGLAKTGITLVAATQSYAALTTSTLALDVTLNAAADVLVAGTPIYLSLTTPQGVAAKADVYIWGDSYTS